MKNKDFEKCYCRSLENGDVVRLNEHGSCVVCGLYWGTFKDYEKIDVSNGNEKRIQVIKDGCLMADITISEEGVFIKRKRGELVKF